MIKNILKSNNTRRVCSLGVISILSGLIGIARDASIVHFLGRTVVTDYIYSVLAITDVVASVLASSFYLVWLPKFTRNDYGVINNKTRHAKIIRQVTCASLCTATALLCFHHVISKTLGDHQDGFAVYCLLVLAVIITPLSAMLVITFHAARIFTVPSLIGILGSITTLTLIWTLSANQTNIALAIILGLIFQVTALSLCYNFGHRLLAESYKTPQSSNVAKTVLGKENKEISILAFCGVVQSALPMIDVYALSTLMDHGHMTAYSCATKLIMFPMALISGVLSTVAYPELANKKFNVYVKWAVVSFILGIIGTIAYIPISNYLVTLIYQRGHFTQADCAEVSQISVVLSLQMCFYMASVMGYRTLIINMQYKWLLIVTASNVLIKYTFIASLIGSMGISAVAYSNLIVFASMLFITHFAINLNKNKENLRD